MFWPKPMPVVVIMQASSNNILALKGTIFDAIFSVKEIGNLERFMDCTNTTQKCSSLLLSVDSKHGTILLDFLAELDDNTHFHGEIMHETLQYGEI